MPINPSHEELFPITSPEEFGIKKHRTTVYRWATAGCRSMLTGKLVKLETLCVGRGLYTSKEAVRRFLNRLNGLGA